MTYLYKIDSSKIHTKRKFQIFETHFFGIMKKTLNFLHSSFNFSYVFDEKIEKSIKQLLLKVSF